MIDPLPVLACPDHARQVFVLSAPLRATGLEHHDADAPGIAARQMLLDGGPPVVDEQQLGPKAQEDAIRAWAEKRGVSAVA